MSYEIGRVQSEFLTNYQIRACHKLAINALAEKLSERRTRAEVEAFVGPLGTYMLRTRNPNRAVGRRYRSGQVFFNVRTVLTTDTNNRVIGCLHSASNVSGSPIERKAKLSTRPDKIYHWVSGISVDPSHWGQGIATRMMLKSLEGVDDRRSVTAYPSPSEDPEFVHKLISLGFVVPEPAYGVADLYGPGSEPATQIRLVAPVPELRANLEARSRFGHNP
ncbi:MAG: GNAT family N-acetyltransferase [Patescibacteria group bacterium]